MEHMSLRLESSATSKKDRKLLFDPMIRKIRLSIIIKLCKRYSGALQKQGKPYRKRGRIKAE